MREVVLCPVKPLVAAVTIGPDCRANVDVRPDDLLEGPGALVVDEMEKGIASGLATAVGPRGAKWYFSDFNMHFGLSGFRLAL